MSGINASRINDPYGNLYKVGILLGSRMEYNLNRRLKLGIGLQYNNKGYKEECISLGNPCTDQKYSRAHHNYVELQPFLEYDIKKRFGINVGFNFGILTHQGGSSSSSLEPIDNGLILGIKYDIKRYTISFYRIQGIRNIVQQNRYVSNKSISNQITLEYRVYSKEGRQKESPTKLMPKVPSQLSLSVVGGINTSKLSISNHDYRIGFLLGGEVKYYTTNRLTLGCRLQYIQKGYNRNRFENHAHYIELVPFLEYNLIKKFGIIAGSNFGVFTYGGANGVKNYEPIDFGIILGIKYDIRRYTFSLYRNVGIMNVKPGWIQSDINRSLINQFTLAYRIYSK